MTTYGDAVTVAADRIRHISPTPRLDALVLLAYAAGVRKERILAEYREPLPESLSDRYEQLVARRETREPVAYLTGSKEFYGRDFYVDPRVLIPRPDTEILIDAIIGSAPYRRIFDLGTGSGCIAITLALELSTQVVGGDVSGDALDVCRLNAERLNALNVYTVEGSLFDAIDGEFDCVVSNPPYLTNEAWRHTYGESWKEPKNALEAGEDGLACIGPIIDQAPNVLVPGGSLFIEAAPPQMAEIRQLYIRRGFSGVTIYRDLAGRDRVISGVLEPGTGS